MDLEKRVDELASGFNVHLVECAETNAAVLGKVKDLERGHTELKKMLGNIAKYIWAVLMILLTGFVGVFGTSWVNNHQANQSRDNAAATAYYTAQDAQQDRRRQDQTNQLILKELARIHPHTSK